MNLHFSPEYKPVPRRGLTPIESVAWVRREFPEVPHWTNWLVRYRHGGALRQLVGRDGRTKGQVGPWSWERIPCSYPEVELWDGMQTEPDRSDCWVGVVRIHCEDGTSFLLFSFLDSMGEIGNTYLASTRDVRVLERFVREVEAQFAPPQCMTITVIGGPSIKLDLAGTERVFLADSLRNDIERQVLSFFADTELYSKLGLRHRRGFLLVGPPGNGKTMLLRHLARQCHQRFRTRVFMLNITQSTRDDDLCDLFHSAEHEAPSLIILEDLDSLTGQSKVSRATLLGQLDGLSPKRGILVIGTTNHPEEIDPALVHRPSRFDRVWHFPLPDCPMRRQYLEWSLGRDGEFVTSLAERTADWSFAYLNELRTTAAILAMERTPPAVTEQDTERAYELLAEQFQAGKKNHAVPTSNASVGFRTA